MRTKDRGGRRLRDNMKYIKLLDQEAIWNAGNVALYDFSRANLNQESREEAVTFVASECYGSEPTDRTKLYNKLLTEHCGGMTSSFEFVRGSEDMSLNGCLRNNKDMPTFENATTDLMFGDFFTSACFNGVATFKLKIPIFLARQIMRHRSFAFSEQSRRYQDSTKSPLEFWLPDNDQISGHMKDASVTAGFLYKRAVSNGARPEVARAVLPQSLMTSFFIQGDIPAWANYFNVRLDTKAQKEHRDLAKLMFGMLREYKPRFFEHMHGYVDNGSEMGYNSDIGMDRPDKWD